MYYLNNFEKYIFSNEANHFLHRYDLSNKKSRYNFKQESTTLESWTEIDERWSEHMAVAVRS